MQIHLLFKKALLAAAVAGVLSMSIALIPDSISHGSSAYAKDGGGGGTVSNHAVCALHLAPSDSPEIRDGRCKPYSGRD
ncbi:hypothetical protein EQ845_29935, partial [Pseudomonas putida]